MYTFDAEAADAKDAENRVKAMRKREERKDWAFRGRLYGAVKKNDLKTVMSLLHENACVTEEHIKALKKAVELGYLKIVEALVRANIDDDFSRAFGFSLIDSAARYNQYPVLGFLLKTIIQRTEPAVQPSEATIYAYLINQLNGATLKGYGDKRPALRSTIRSSLAEALTEKVDGLIALNNDEKLKAELAGLEAIKSQVNLLQGKGGPGRFFDEKRSVTTINTLIQQLQDIIHPAAAPMDAIPVEGHIEHVDAIILRQRLENQLVAAARSGDIDMVQKLLDQGVFVDCRDDKDRYTPLYVAIDAGHAEVVKLLLDHDASRTNLKFFSLKRGVLCMLHFAVLRGRVDVVKVFLDKWPALLNEAKANEDHTLLYTAARNGCTDVVKYLIDNGAIINLTSSNELRPTPLDIALANRETSAANVIIDAINHKIRSFIPENYPGLLEYLNDEKPYYDQSAVLRERIRLLLTAPLSERVGSLLRLGDTEAIKKERDHLSMLKTNLDIIQKTEDDFRDKHAMVEIKRLIAALDEKIKNPHAQPVIKPPRAQKKSFIGTFFGGAKPVAEVTSPDGGAALRLHTDL